MKNIVLVFDIDGTIVKEDTIFEFFGKYGMKEKAVALNARERSSDVKIVLNEIALKEKIPLSVFEKVGDEATFFDGAQQFFSQVKNSVKLVFISATYQPIAERVVARLGLKNALVKATKIRVENGKCTGFLGPLMEGRVKAEALNEISFKLGVPLNNFVGVGDGELDAPFIKAIVEAGGLGIVVSGNENLARNSLAQAVMPFPNYPKILELVKKFAGEKQ